VVSIKKGTIPITVCKCKLLAVVAKSLYRVIIIIIIVV
jgi:hypothetical protein